MTEREADVWVSRLTRIWEHRSTHPQVRFCEKKNVFYFQAVVDGATDLDFAILVASCAKDKWHFKLSYDLVGLIHNNGEINDWGRGKGQLTFNVQYLDTFRRGCFLMGLAIEASAHEKAEWVQGFSHEELEAWNLRI